MSEESIGKKSTKKWRKSERGEKELKTEKRRKSGTAEGSLPECSSPSIIKLESTRIRDSTSTRKVGDETCSTLPGTVGKDKVSRKRKRTIDDALFDDHVKVETDFKFIEHELRQNKKRDTKNEVLYQDPAVDQSLSEQSRRALSYAYERCRGTEVWKFNKARQNWLLRNVWSAQAVRESYIPLVIGYLTGIRGGAREKLINECISKMSAPESEPMQGAQPSDDSNNNIRSRALSILYALRKESSCEDFN